MANPQHVALLKRSIWKWNQWRKRYPKIVPDFSNANLRRVQCPKVNLNGANLVEANLFKADLRGANLRGANLEKAALIMANLQGANFQGAGLQETDLIMANLQGANFQGADLRGAYFRNVNLMGAKNLSYDQMKSVGNLDETTKLPSYLKARFLR